MRDGTHERLVEARREIRHWYYRIRAARLAGRIAGRVLENLQTAANRVARFELNAQTARLKYDRLAGSYVETVEFGGDRE